MLLISELKGNMIPQTKEEFGHRHEFCAAPGYGHTDK